MPYCPETAFALRFGTNILCLNFELCLEGLLAHLTRLVPGPVRLINVDRPDHHPGLPAAPLSPSPPEQGGIYSPGNSLGKVHPGHGPKNDTKNDPKNDIGPDPAVLAACVRMARACLAGGHTPLDHPVLRLCRELGVPLITAQPTAIPAHRAVILERPDPALAAALIAALVRDRFLARAAAPMGSTGLKYLVDGPHEGSYSLSLLNRELALALEKLAPGRVGLDFLCRPAGQSRSGRGGGLRGQDLDVLRARAEAALPVRAVLWNSYPPYVFSRPGAISVTGSYGWEESRLPVEHAARFNAHLDGMTVMSDFVRKVLVDNGVALPIHVVGLGLDHVRRAAPEPLDLDLGPGFRFLHVSSCFPRKGVDVLLAAYGRAFTAKDNVTLIIKCFPNPHNTVEQDIAALRAENPSLPRIVLINQDLPEARLKELYRQCHALVAPSRGEGFGLPMAEAMLLGLPVITTGHGGQTDFCTPRNAWLIDWDFALARTHLNRFGSVWAEPRVDHLAALLREVFQAGPEHLAPRLEAARDTAAALTWEACARRVEQAVTAMAKTRPLQEPGSTAWISTWNSPCGIAKYSEYLCAHLPPAPRVHHLAPVWERRLGPDHGPVSRCFGHEDFGRTLPAMIRELGCATAVIQFHFAFFNLAGFARLLRELRRMRVKTLVVFHTLGGPADPLRRIARDLALADRLLVHTVADLNRFKAMGLVDNVTYFPQGVLYRPGHPGHSVHPDQPSQPAQAARPHRFARPGPAPSSRLIAGFGFLLPHKGVLELIQATAGLVREFPDLHLLLPCALYPKPASRALHAACLEQISALDLAPRVTLITAFLHDDQLLDLLAPAELIVFPYQHSQESSSAAVRFGLAARRPVVCTPLPIFQDVADVVHTLPGTSATDIRQGLGHLLADPARAASTLDLQNQWLAAHSWQATGRLLSGMIRALHAQP